MPYQVDRIRWIAVVAYERAGHSLTRAVDAFKELTSKLQFEGIKAPYAFIREQAHKFAKWRDVSNRTAGRKPSTPKKVPDSEVKKCTTALKQGYTQKLVVQGAGGVTTTTSVHMYYTTIDEACRHNHVLAATIERYNVTPRHLLRRMHQLDPNLTMRTVHFRHMLTAEQKLARQVCAATMLFRWIMDPSLLIRTYWIDETTLWIIKTGVHLQKVYCDAHDNGVHSVVSTPHLGTHQKIKIHILGVVNALTGFTFWEYTTGTTGNYRRLQLEHAPYKVRMVQGMAAAIRTRMPILS